MDLNKSDEIKIQRICDILLLLCPEDIDNPPLLLAILLFAFALDSGFCLLCNDSQVEVEPSLPNGWINNPLQVYKCKLQPVGYSGCTCLFVATGSIESMFVNCISPQGNSGFTICLPIIRYVPSPKENPVFSKFAFTKELRSIFVNNVLLPARSVELLVSGFLSGSLIGLPEEIIRKIMILSGGKAAVNMARCCRRFNSMIVDMSIWRPLLRKDYFFHFRGLKNVSNVNWYDEYKKCHKFRYPEQVPLTCVRYGRTTHRFYDP